MRVTEGLVASVDVDRSAAKSCCECAEGKKHPALKVKIFFGAPRRNFISGRKRSLMGISGNEGGRARAGAQGRIRSL